MRYTEDNILSLNPGEIFTYGSNERGAMGKGAALLAYQKFGARYGFGMGLQGQSYAIPTKDYNIRTLSLDSIKKYVDVFIDFASKNKQYTFLVTKIGCGLAGYKISDISPLFLPARFLENCVFPKEFHDIWCEVHEKV